MRRIFPMFIMTVLCWVCVACSTPTPTNALRLSIGDDSPDVYHTLTVTIRDATTSSGQSVDGNIVISSRRQADTRQIRIASMGTVTPRWLVPFGGTLTVVTTPTDTWQIDNGCSRDGSMLPTIAMRDVLGPMTGFVPDGDGLSSGVGGASWQRFTAQAKRDHTGQLTAMTGSGSGKILLPGGEVVTGDITWQYETAADSRAISIPPRCSDSVYAALSLPASWQNRRPYGGAVLAESSQPLVPAAADLVAFLATNGWDASVTQSDAEQVVIDATLHSDTVRLFLVSNPQGGVDLTMIVQP